MTPASQNHFLPITQQGWTAAGGNIKMVKQCLLSPFLEGELQDPKHSVIV